MFIYFEKIVFKKKRNPEGLRRRSTKGGGLGGYALASAKMLVLND